MKYTLLLIALSIIVFFIPLFAFNDAEQLQAFYNDYGFSSGNVAAHPWILITAVFLHGSLEHLLANVLVWLFFGIAVESELGAPKMLAVFFAGAFVAYVPAILFYSPGTVFIGASAGIFALIGVGMLIKPMDVSLYPLVVPIPLAFLGLVYILYNIYAIFAGIGGNTAYLGHLAGVCLGFAYGIHRVGMKKALKIILITLAILIAVPLIILFLL